MAFSDDRWGLYIGLIIAFLSLAAIPFVLMYRRRHCPGLQHRGLIITLLNGALSSVFVCFLSIRLIVETPISCIVDVWFSTILLVLYAFLLIARSLRVIFLYHVSEVRYRMTRNFSEISGFSIDSDMDADVTTSFGNERQHKLMISLSASAIQKSSQNRRRLSKSWRSHEHLDTHSRQFPPIMRKLSFGVRKTPSITLLRKKKSRSRRDKKTEFTDEHNSQAELMEMENIHVVEHNVETDSRPKSIIVHQSSHLPVDYLVGQSEETQRSGNESEITTANDVPSSTGEASPAMDGTQWSSELSSSKNIKFDFLSIKPEKPNYTWIYRHRHWIRTPFILHGFCLILIMQVIINITIQMVLGPGPVVTPSTVIICLSSQQYYIVYIIVAVMAIIITLIILFPLRCINDAFFIRIELITSVITIGFCGALAVFTFIYRYANPSEVTVQSYISTISQIGICMSTYFIAIIFPLIDAIRLDRLSRAAIGFAESLTNPASFEKFKIFSIIDFSVENVLFYDRVRRLRILAIKKQGNSSAGNGIRRHRPNTIDTTANNEALARRIEKEIRNIYIKFIVPGSEYELNLEYDTRKSIMMAIQQDEFDVAIYDVAFNEISNLLVNNTYPRFLQWNSGQSKTDDIDGPTYLSRSANGRRQSTFSEAPSMVVVENPNDSNNHDNK